MNLDGTEEAGGEDRDAQLLIGKTVGQALLDSDMSAINQSITFL